MGKEKNSTKTAPNLNRTNAKSCNCISHIWVLMVCAAPGWHCWLQLAWTLFSAFSFSRCSFPWQAFQALGLLTSWGFHYMFGSILRVLLTALLGALCLASKAFLRKPGGSISDYTTLTSWMLLKSVLHDWNEVSCQLEQQLGSLVPWLQPISEYSEV